MAHGDSGPAVAAQLGGVAGRVLQLRSQWPGRREVVMGSFGDVGARRCVLRRTRLGAVHGCGFRLEG